MATKLTLLVVFPGPLLAFGGGVMSQHRFLAHISAPVPAVACPLPAFVAVAMGCPTFAASPFIHEVYRLAMLRTQSQLAGPVVRDLPAFSLN